MTKSIPVPSDTSRQARPTHVVDSTAADLALAVRDQLPMIALCGTEWIPYTMQPDSELHPMCVSCVLVMVELGDGCRVPDWA